MSDLNDLFVSYEISKSLKKKGFDHPCIAYFQPNLEGKINAFYGSIEDYDVNDQDSPIICRPMFEQAVAWFREKHNLIIYVHKTTLPDRSKFVGIIEHKYNTEHLTDYYVALEITILQALELI